jgi:hypothetical protein
VVVINPLPTNLTLTASSTTVCKNANVVLTAAATGASSYSLDNSTWLAGTTFNMSQPSTTEWTLYAKTAAGCTASSDAAVTVTAVDPPVAPTMGGAGRQCNSRQITASAGTGGTGVRWNDNGLTTSPRTVTVTNTYYAVTVGPYCNSSNGSVYVKIDNPPTEGQPKNMCNCGSLSDCDGTCKKNCWKCSGTLCSTWTSWNGVPAISSCLPTPDDGKMYVLCAVANCAVQRAVYYYKGSIAQKFINDGPANPSLLEDADKVYCMKLN